MPVFSMATVLVGVTMLAGFGLAASVILTLRFPHTRGESAEKWLGGRRWLFWFIPCLAMSAWGAELIMSQSSDNVLSQTYVKTVAQDRHGNAYVVLNDGQTRQCAVATECIALPDNTVITYRWERHDDRSLMRIIGKG